MKKKYGPHGYYRSFACVDLGAIKYNFEQLKNRLAPEVKTMAVVKADAYGHGSVKVSQVLENMTDYFAVSVIEEATVLRRNGIKKPILILTYTSPAQFETLINYDLIATIYSYEDAVKLSQAAKRLGEEAVMHIAVDTGMERIGFKDTDESADIVAEITKLPSVRVEGLFSHLACADSKDKANANSQIARFDSFIEKLESRGVDIPIKHICNSAAAIDFENHYDLVRLGISLYGLYPSEDVDKSKVSLKPAMEVLSHVIHVKEVEAGTGIGYGHAYVTPENKKIATVCIGYADGYSRAYSNKGVVLINGKRAPVVGRVCMDQIMVDVTDIDDVKTGDLAIIMGESGNEYLSAEELGALADSFNYEIICTFMPRISRFYHDK